MKTDWAAIGWRSLTNDVYKAISYPILTDLRLKIKIQIEEQVYWSIQDHIAEEIG